jgi:hypothetical protein
LHLVGYLVEAAAESAAVLETADHSVFVEVQRGLVVVVKPRFLICQVLLDTLFHFQSLSDGALLGLEH